MSLNDYMLLMWKRGRGFPAHRVVAVTEQIGHCCQNPTEVLNAEGMLVNRNAGGRSQDRRLESWSGLNRVSFECHPQESELYPHSNGKAPRGNTNGKK